MLIGRSPLLLLSGLGALGAVLMLVFKDTILSLVASVQIASNDLQPAREYRGQNDYLPTPPDPLVNPCQETSL